MTAEQLEELLEKVTPPDKDGDWVPDIDYDGDYENGWDAELSLMTYSLARRVLAAEKLVEAFSGMIEDAERVGWDCADERATLTAYREASK